MSDQLILSVASILLSGVIAAAITLYVNHRREKLLLKRQVLYGIFGSRQVLSNSDDDVALKRELSSALNRVPVVFSDESKVLESYDRLFYVLQIDDQGERNAKANEELVTLLKTLCKACHVDTSDWNDSRITRVMDIK